MTSADAIPRYARDDALAHDPLFSFRLFSYRLFSFRRFTFRLFTYRLLPTAPVLAAIRVSAVAQPASNG
jgi:hypothetical protein